MPYNPSVKAPAEVYVDGTRIPVFSIETHIRKDGLLNKNYLSEIHFPSNWNGVNYNEIVKPLSVESDNPYSKVVVNVRNPATDELEVSHAGFVNGVGQSASGQLSRQMQVVGLESFLTAIPVSKQFGKDARVKDVLDFIIDELERAQPIADNIQLAGTYGDEIVILEDDTESGLITTLFGDNIVTPKSFANNRHTLIDVVNWLTEAMSSYVWFEYDGTNENFVLRYEQSITNTSHQASHLGGDITVINNDCLNQVGPYNSITTNGRSQESVFSVGGHSLLLPSDQFPQARVYHPRLYELAGEEYLEPPTEDVSAVTIDGAVNQATNILKRMINESGGGEIITRPSPSIQPYHTLRSRPACNEVVDTNIPPITYEVEEVVHVIDSTEQTQTELFCSIHIDPADIEVDVAEMKDA